jgi:hypothetical protein
MNAHLRTAASTLRRCSSPVFDFFVSPGNTAAAWRPRRSESAQAQQRRPRRQGGIHGRGMARAAQDDARTGWARRALAGPAGGCGDARCTPLAPREDRTSCACHSSQTPHGDQQISTSLVRRRRSAHVHDHRPHWRHPRAQAAQ